MKRRSLMKIGCILVILILVISFSSCDLLFLEVIPLGQYGDFTYKILGRKVYIMSYEGTETEVVVPDIIEGRKVTHYYPMIFGSSSNVQSLTLSQYSEEISWQMCAYNAALTSVTIPGSVQEIKESAFVACPGLDSVIIPDSVTTIGSGIFSECENLEYIYCKAASQPPDWNQNWSSGCNAVVVWGYVSP